MNLISKKNSLVSLTALSAATASQAAIQVGLPFELIANGESLTGAWDIDNNGSVDGTWSAIASNSSAGGLLQNSTSVAPIRFMGASSDALSVLTASGSVGNSGAFFLFRGYATSASSYNPGFAENVATTIGFRFDRGGNTHYGIADAEYQIDPANTLASLSFSNVLWNDVAGESIQANAVPEPASTATGLGLLALGVVGMRRWRVSKSA